MSQWGGKGREKKSTAISGGGRKEARVKRGEARALGWLLSPSSCRSWTTLRMETDKEETGFVEGSHQPSMNDGEFRCRSKATLGACCYGSAFSMQGGWGFMNLSVHFFWCHRLSICHTLPHVVLEPQFVKSKLLITWSQRPFPEQRASISMIPGANGEKQLIQAEGMCLLARQLGWKDNGTLLGFWRHRNEIKGTHHCVGIKTY